MGAEGSGTGRGRAVGEGVIAMGGEVDRRESGGFDQRVKRSFQERTGNSAGPQGDVLFGSLGYRLGDDDVGDLQPAARFEDAGRLGQDRCLVRAEVYGPVGDHHISAVVRDGEASRYPSRNSRLALEIPSRSAFCRPFSGIVGVI